MTHTLSDTELREIYTFALDLGRRAGKILIDGVEKRTGDQSGREVEEVEKMNAVDIVTQTDLGTISFSSVFFIFRFLLLVALQFRLGGI